MTVLYGIGTVLRVILRIALLPVQAVLTLLMLLFPLNCRLVSSRQQPIERLTDSM